MKMLQMVLLRQFYMYISWKYLNIIFIYKVKHIISDINV